MRAFISAACLLFVAALAGCSNMVGTADSAKPLPEDPNAIKFTTANYAFDVRFAVAAENPSAEEVKRLQDFLHSSSARPGDKVTVSGDVSSLGRTRGAHVIDLLKKAGLEPVAGVDISLAPNTVSLVLTETVAVAPKCGDWPVFAGDQPSNAPALFLGCALHSDLYQQVVDKRDLAVGQIPGPADAEPGMRAVQKYREGTKDKKDKDGGDDNGGDNSAADSAMSAAGAAAGMANSGSGIPGVGGSGNGQ
jgi:type IV pilus biogenesis protein CpaD/CtpE